MKLMTFPEEAKYLRYTESYMRKFVMLKKVPYYKLERAVRFEKEELDEYIKERRVKTN